MLAEQEIRFFGKYLAYRNVYEKYFCKLLTKEIVKNILRGGDHEMLSR